VQELGLTGPQRVDLKAVFDRMHTAAVALGQAELRAAHLRTRLETKWVLTAQQVALYDSLRGYAAPAHS